MKQIAWLTDIHLEFLQPDELHTFVDQLTHSMPDIVLVGGDTGIAVNFASFFQYLEERLKHCFSQV